jgi:hypothetical protein
MTALELSTNFAPRTTLGGVRIVRIEAFAKNLKMPFWNSHLLGTVDDRVPQGLHVFDLLVDRELVETWRWIGNWLSHSATLAPREH